MRTQLPSLPLAGGPGCPESSISNEKLAWSCQYPIHFGSATSKLLHYTVHGTAASAALTHQCWVAGTKHTRQPPCSGTNHPGQHPPPAVIAMRITPGPASCWRAPYRTHAQTPVQRGGALRRAAAAPASHASEAPASREVVPPVRGPPMAGICPRHPQSAPSPACAPHTACLTMHAARLVVCA